MDPPRLLSQPVITNGSRIETTITSVEISGSLLQDMPCTWSADMPNIGSKALLTMINAASTNVANTRISESGSAAP